jgi:hypothetical protein
MVAVTPEFSALLDTHIKEMFEHNGLTVTKSTFCEMLLKTGMKSLGVLNDAPGLEIEASGA